MIGNTTCATGHDDTLDTFFAGRGSVVNISTDKTIRYFPPISTPIAVNIPYATSIYGSVISGPFMSNSAITKVTAERCTALGNRAFENCVNLQEYVGANTETVNTRAFYDCQNLSKVTLKAETILDLAFTSCSKLMSVYLLGSSVASLGLDAFAATPIRDDSLTGSYGSVYVPASLVSSYRSATRWSDFSSRITELPSSYTV